MAPSRTQQVTELIREDVVASSIRMLFAFATLLFVIALARATLSQQPLSPAIAGIYLLACGFFLFHRRLSLKWRALLMTALFGGAGAMSLITYGLAGQAVILLLAMIFLANASFGSAVGNWVGAAGAAMLLGTLGARQAGLIRHDFDVGAYLAHPLAWLSTAATLVVLARMIGLQTSRLAARMVEVWREQDERAAALDEANAKLRDEMAENARVTATLRERELSYRDLFSLSPDAVLVVHDGVITDLNAAAMALLRVWQREQALGTHLRIWIDDGEPADRKPGEPADSSEVRLRSLDGHQRTAELRTAQAMIDGRGAVLATLRDITERKVAEARVMRLAQHDALTDLPNRALLEDRLGQALDDARRDQGRVAVMFIDLDRFKTINDTLGHSTGDQLLIEVGRRLSSVSRPCDLLARLGGDEFVLLITQIERIEDLTAVAERVLGALREPVRLERYELSATPSIGISVFPEDGEDGATLLRHADAAMYQAKSGGRNTYRYFLPQMNRAALDRIALEQKLRTALKEDAFELHYQITVDRVGRFAGAEALLRWSLPGEGAVPPDRFIPIAEEIGLMVPLGEWVFDHACRQARIWLDSAMPAFRIAVNLSATQLRHPALAANLARVIARHRLPPSVIELEISESTVMENPPEAARILGALKKIGLMLAIDEFGTGYSSLSFLKSLPIDHLKIDRSFVSGLSEDADRATVVKATIAMAHSLGLTVIADGVESEDQARLLLDFGCDAMQGYLFGRPAPADWIETLLRREAIFP